MINNLFISGLLLKESIKYFLIFSKSNSDTTWDCCFTTNKILFPTVNYRYIDRNFKLQNSTEMNVTYVHFPHFLKKEPVNHFCTLIRLIIYIHLLEMLNIINWCAENVHTLKLQRRCGLTKDDKYKSYYINKLHLRRRKKRLHLEYHNNLACSNILCCNQRNILFD